VFVAATDAVDDDDGKYDVTFIEIWVYFGRGAT
jgi:hypothetical protein